MSELQDQIEAIGDQLRDKIRSKFQSSTFLAGFGFTILSIEISMLWTAQRVPRLLPLSIPLILAAICFFVVAALKLDALTMPKLFWERDPNTTDEEALQLSYLVYGNLLQIQRRMIFYWTWLTVLATFVTAVSLVLVLLPIDSIERSDLLVKETFQNGIVVLTVTLVHILLLYALEKRLWKPLHLSHD